MNECIPALWKTIAVYNMFQKSWPIFLSFFFLKYEIHPPNFRGINRESPLLMHVEVEILSNVTDLGQSQAQATSSYNYSPQHAGEYWHDFEPLATTNIHRFLSRERQPNISHAFA